MNNLDLDKLCEECAEAIQAASKLKLYYATCTPRETTWEKTEAELIQFLQDEIADVTATISMVIQKRWLNESEIISRAEMKAQRFEKWGFYN